MVRQLRDLTEEELETRISTLLDLFESEDFDESNKQDLVELYVLRDLQMKLDLKDQINWAIGKLQTYYPVRQELYSFRDKTDNYQFYCTCTFDELMCLGY